MIREARSNLELLARLTGQFDSASTSSLITALILVPSAPLADSPAAEGVVIDIAATR